MKWGCGRHGKKIKAWTEYKRINKGERTKVYKKKTFADIWAIYLVLILIIIQISTLNVELNILRPHITRNNFNLRRQLWYKAKDHYVANRFQQTCVEKLLMSWKWRKICQSKQHLTALQKLKGKENLLDKLMLFFLVC